MNPLAGFGGAATHSSPAARATAVAAIWLAVSGTARTGVGVGGLGAAVEVADRGTSVGMGASVGMAANVGTADGVAVGFDALKIGVAMLVADEPGSAGVGLATGDPVATLEGDVVGATAAGAQPAASSSRPIKM